jgi:very-short-patch-repair endonuclease
MERPRRQIRRSRHLRVDSTKQERLFWSKVRAGRLRGLKFRRQHPVLGHILDFACPTAKVAIELDGPIHDATKEEADNRKTAVLEQHGWVVLRYSLEELGERQVSVLDQVVAVCFERLGLEDID